MIPIRDSQRVEGRPWVNYAFVALNVAMFLYQLGVGASGGPQALEAFVQRFGVVPYWLTHGAHPGSWVTPLTSMFMHGGWMHVLSNMWFLHIFGDNVEDSLGRAKYVAFYFTAGLAAVAAQVLLDPTSRVPMVGASGAVAGVLGGYLVLHPRARILTLVPILFVHLMEVPAVVFIALWFVLQLVGGLQSLGSVGLNLGGVAFFAHLGGFAAGVILAKLLGRARSHPSRRVRYVRRDERGWYHRP